MDDLYHTQQDIELLSDSVSQAHKLLQLLETGGDDCDAFILPTADWFIGASGDKWHIKSILAKEKSAEKSAKTKKSAANKKCSPWK
jgi:hypothetical protein